MLKICYALILLMTVASIAVAASSQKKQHYCLILAGSFQTAASARDQGLSPKQTYDILLGSELHPMAGKPELVVSKAKLKRIVNMVYFNPDFTYAGGNPLFNQVFNSCMGIHQYKPLR